jgi:hypothetical protein
MDQWIKAAGCPVGLLMLLPLGCSEASSAVGDEGDGGVGGATAAGGGAGRGGKDGQGGNSQGGAAGSGGGMPHVGGAAGSVGGSGGGDPVLGNTCTPGPHGLSGMLAGQTASIDRPNGFSFVADDWWLTGSLELGGLFYLAGSGFELERELAIEHAVFRWPDGEHDDTFFCAGAGSSITPSNDGSCVVLRSLSRLGKCSALAPGTDAVTGEVGVTNSFSGTVNGQPYTRHSGGGRASLQQPNGSTAYELGFANPPAQGDLSEYPMGLVSFRVAQPLSTTAQPLLEPYVFEAAPGPPLIICGGPGSIASAPASGSTAFELKQATTLSCPGEPIEGRLEAFVKSNF